MCGKNDGPGQSVVLFRESGMESLSCPRGSQFVVEVNNLSLISHLSGFHSMFCSGGVKFSELDSDDCECCLFCYRLEFRFDEVLIGYSFQENLLKTMMQIEQTYFTLAKNCSRNCLIIFDRGTMDPSACTCQVLFSATAGRDLTSAFVF